MAHRRPGTTLVFLYGPPAVGKLTVARALSRLTGFKLFHNQLTVDLVRALFDWGTPAYQRFVGRYRRELLAAAVRHRVRGVVFTYAYCAEHGTPTVRRYVATTRSYGGRVVWVRLVAPRAVLLRRVGHALRRRHDKITSQRLLRQVLREHDFATSVPLGQSLTLDTSRYTPRQAARLIVRHYALPQR